MRRISLRTLVLGLFLGSVSGFILANTIHRNDVGAERQGPRVQTKAQAPPFNQTANPEQSNNSRAAIENSENDNSLSPVELRQAIVKADENKDNHELQRNLGIALFKYAVLEQKTDLLPDAVRLLERADQKYLSKDRELFETLGNALFVLARQQEPEKMILARAAYQKAFQIEPKDAGLLVNIGLTYFYEEPSNPSAAIIQYKRALILQPLDEKALENLTRACLSLGQIAKARENLKRLQEINPQNKALDDLQTELSQQQIVNP